MAQNFLIPIYVGGFIFRQIRQIKQIAFYSGEPQHQWLLFDSPAGGLGGGSFWLMRLILAAALFLSLRSGTHR
jgi:hypothetical protein